MGAQPVREFGQVKHFAKITAQFEQAMSVQGQCRGDMAVAVIISLIEGVQPHVVRQASQHGAEVAVHRSPDLIVGGKREADTRDTANRVARRKHIKRPRYI